jgi:arsenate reductase
MSFEVHLYGIKNCDTVRKSIKWLEEKQIDCEFHDLKTKTLPTQLISEWLEQVEKDKLINKRGLTWRKLPSEDKLLKDDAAVIKLIQANPTVVKRPVMFNGKFWSVGFNPDDWNHLFL